jgi:hypothetical protein
VVLDARSLVQSALSQQQQGQQQQGAQAGNQQQQQAQAVQQEGAAAAAAGSSEGVGVQLAQKLSTSMRLDISEQVGVREGWGMGCYDHSGTIYRSLCGAGWRSGWLWHALSALLQVSHLHMVCREDSERRDSFN